ncbi:MAG: hypothetical protein V1739_04305 [Candidatus Omnitrophota bacterium]
MDKIILGDRLYNILNTSKYAIFKLGEFLQLSYNAFEFTASNIKNSKEITFKMKYPCGVRPDGQTILSELTYKKDDYIKHYQHLAQFQLPLNGIYQLVTTTEIMLADLIREILLEHPKKIGKKRTILFSSIFECSSLEDIHLTATSSFINELSYKSPGDFAETASEIFSFNILEIPAYHKYIEVKATRDIFIHDRGIANLTYKNKASTHSRVAPGETLPMNIAYFLYSYEACLKLNEILIEKFHDIWQSSEYTKYKKLLTTQSTGSEPAPSASSSQ